MTYKNIYFCTKLPHAWGTSVQGVGQVRAGWVWVCNVCLCPVSSPARTHTSAYVDDLSWPAHRGACLGLAAVTWPVGAPGLGRRPASWPHRYPRSLQTGHRRRRFGATFGANLKEWNHWHKCAPAMHARTCPTQVFSKYFILGGWNIPRGWKNKFATVGLIEWASLQWILKSRTLILIQDQEKLIFKKSFESARKTHIRDFF